MVFHTVGVWPFGYIPPNMVILSQKMDAVK